jgi:hypothetical protein
MAISFPGSKSNGQKFTHGNKSWTWNGASWKGSTSTGGDATSLGGTSASSFLRSDADDMTSGKLTIDSTGQLYVRYNNSNLYRAGLDWNVLQLGNNGQNKVVAGHNATGGYFRFYVNNTSDVAGGTPPNGISAMTIAASGNLDIGGSAGSMKLNVNGDIYLGDNSATTNGLYGGGNVVVSSDNDVLIIGDGNTSSPSASNKITIGWGNTANINYDSLRGAALDSLTSPAVVTAEFYTDHAKMLKQLQLLNSSSNPSAPKTGAIYYNTTDDTVKVYNGTEWIDVGAPPMNATGGTVATYTVGGQSYRSHTFTSSGTFTPTVTGTVDVMVVAGGGCGGRDNAGGGGAGGVRQNTNVVVTPSSYTIVVGAGGAANTNDNGGNGGTGFNGSNSSAISITSLGGGFGGSAGTNNPGGQNRANGGSGGGGCGAESTRTGGSGTAGQGNNGGAGHPTNGGGGGGGGAGAVGTDYSGTNDGGHGGIGIQNAYRTGSNIYYGGGGGAGNNNSVYTVQPGGSGGGGDGGGGGIAGSANTGGGGGGHTHPATIVSGAGGSGIVVIRYPI